MSTKTKEQISFNMKQVKNKDSDIELMLRKELWNRGLRYRKTRYCIQIEEGCCFL